MNIPDDAREAAVPWICDFLKRRGLVLRGKEAQVLAGYVLEAAAPDLIKSAYDEGYRKACEDIIAAKPTGKPTPYPRDSTERPKIEMALTLYMAGEPIDWICASTGVSKAHLNQARKLRHIPDRPQRADGTLRKSARQRDAT